MRFSLTILYLRSHLSIYVDNYLVDAASKISHHKTNPVMKLSKLLQSQKISNINDERLQTNHHKARHNNDSSFQISSSKKQETIKHLKKRRKNNLRRKNSFKQNNTRKRNAYKVMRKIDKTTIYSTEISRRNDRPRFYVISHIKRKQKPSPTNIITTTSNYANDSIFDAIQLPRRTTLNMTYNLKHYSTNFQIRRNTNKRASISMNEYSYRFLTHADFKVYLNQSLDPEEVGRLRWRWLTRKWGGFPQQTRKWGGFPQQTRDPAVTRRWYWQRQIRRQFLPSLNKAWKDSKGNNYHGGIEGSLTLQFLTEFLKTFIDKPLQFIMQYVMFMAEVIVEAEQGGAFLSYEEAGEDMVFFVEGLIKYKPYEVKAMARGALYYLKYASFPLPTLLLIHFWDEVITEDEFDVLEKQVLKMAKITFPDPLQNMYMFTQEMFTNCILMPILKVKTLDKLDQWVKLMDAFAKMYKPFYLPKVYWTSNETVSTTDSWEAGRRAHYIDDRERVLAKIRGIMVGKAKKAQEQYRNVRIPKPLIQIRSDEYRDFAIEVTDFESVIKYLNLLEKQDMKIKTQTANVGNASAMVVNATAMVGNASAMVGNATALVGNATAKASNATAMVGNATTLVGYATAMVGNASAMVGNASAMVGNASKIGNATAIIREENATVIPRNKTIVVTSFSDSIIESNV